METPTSSVKDKRWSKNRTVKDMRIKHFLTMRSVMQLEAGKALTNDKKVLDSAIIALA